MKTRKVYISLGANGRGREQRLLTGALRLSRSVGLILESLSSLYESQPVDWPCGGLFVNAVARIDCRLGARELLRTMQQIESLGGRMRGSRPEVSAGDGEGRGLDLDLLYYGSERIDTGLLTVPHPAVHCRAFVLVPLLEIDPGFEDPVTGEAARESLESRPGGPFVRVVSGRRLHFPPENSADGIE